MSLTKSRVVASFAVSRNAVFQPSAIPAKRVRRTGSHTPARERMLSAAPPSRAAWVACWTVCQAGPSDRSTVTRRCPAGVSFANASAALSVPPPPERALFNASWASRSDWTASACCLSAVVTSSEPSTPCFCRRLYSSCVSDCRLVISTSDWRALSRANSAWMIWSRFPDRRACWRPCSACVTAYAASA